MIASGILGGLAGLGIGAVFDAAGHWVAEGSVWVLGQVGSAMSATTEVPVNAKWFPAHEAVMAAMAAAVIMPMLCAAAIQAVLRQSPGMLARAFLVQMPLALLLTGVALTVVQLALAATDAMSAQVLSNAGGDTERVIAPVAAFLTAAGGVSPAAPTFVLFIGALVVAFAALGLWVELVVRSAAVSVAVLFLPLALAALVWPAVSHWARRLAETLAALVLSKLVIAGVLSLSAAAIAGGLGVNGPGGGGFASVIAGIAMLVVATASPFMLLRLVPAFEAGAAGHLEAARHRVRSGAQAAVRGRNFALDIAKGIGGSGGDGSLELAAGALASAATGGGAGAAAMVGTIASRGAGAVGSAAAAAGPGSSAGAQGSSAGAGATRGSGNWRPGVGPGPEGSQIPWAVTDQPSPELVDLYLQAIEAGVPQSELHDAVTTLLNGGSLEDWLGRDSNAQLPGGGSADV